MLVASSSRETSSRRRDAVDGPNAALDAVRAFRGPLLVVESGADTVVPAEMVQAYVRAAPQAEHVVMAGVEHALQRPEWRADFLSRLLAFFAGL